MSEDKKEKYKINIFVEANTPQEASAKFFKSIMLRDEMFINVEKLVEETP
jgi:hypothetical protein